MADLGITLHVDDEIDAPDFEPMPEGDYELQIIEADVKPNSKNTGTLLEYKAEVVSGEFAGKKHVFGRINIQHEKATAQSIGQRELQDLIKAAGLVSVSDTDALLYQPFWASLVIETYQNRNNEDRSRNAVKKYLSGDAPAAAPPANKPAPQRQAPQPSRQAPAQNRQAPQSRPASGGSKPSLPWQGRNAGGANGRPSNEMDDEIPF